MNLPGQWPARHYSRVWHIGTFDSSQKGSRGASYEGHGLSVSRHPRIWQRIARLSGELYQLQYPHGAFLDYYRLRKQEHVAIQVWALAAGFLEETSAYEISWFDTELEERLSALFIDKATAEAEYAMRREEDEHAALRETRASCATQLLQSRMGFKVDPLLACELAATCYVEDCTELDGIWWADALAPEQLSAPRGVILPSRLSRWSTERQPL